LQTTPATLARDPRFGCWRPGDERIRALAVYHTPSAGGPKRGRAGSRVPMGTSPSVGGDRGGGPSGPPRMSAMSAYAY